MKKRIISTLLVVALLLSFSAAAFADGGDGYSLRNQELFESQQEFLRTIGLLDKKETILPSDIITRGRFAKLVCDAVKMSANAPADDEKTVFSDVEAGHIYSDSIYALYSMKVIKGDGAKFYPNDGISYSEALHMFLCAMGYGDYIGYSGGYPAGDYKIAKRIGIDNYGENDTNAENLIALAVDCLKAQMLEIVSYSKDNAEYDNKDSDTILEKYFGIDYGVGILESDGVVSINPACKADSKTVVIDGESFSSNLKFGQRPGLNVEYYYKSDNKELVYLYTDDENDVFELNADDIIEFSDMAYKYDEGGRSKTLRLKQSIAVVYNDELMQNFESSLMVPADGHVMLIDNNRDGAYEVLYVFSYTSFLVRGVTEGDDSITVFPDSKLGIKPLKISMDSREKTLIRSEKGFVDYKAIKAGVSVSAYLVDSGASYYTCHEAIVSGKTIKGDITSVNTSENTYTINGKDYKFTHLFETVKASGVGVTSGLTFYLNHEDKIVDIGYDDSGEMAYGYILDAGSSNNSFDGTVIQVKMFSELGRIVIYDLSNKKITVDGTAYKNNTAVAVEPKLFNTDGSVKKQLIRYGVNSDKEIVEVDFANDIIQSSRAEDNNTLFRLIPETTLYYKKNITTFSNRIKIGDSTLIMKMTGSASADDESEFSIITADDITSEGKYLVEAYTKDPLAVNANVVILKYNYDDLPIDSKPVIVKNAFSALNEAGEKSVSLIVDGQDGEQKLVCKNADVANKAKAVSVSDLNTYKVKVGDVVKYATDKNGEVDTIRIIYKYDSDTMLNAFTPNMSNVFNNNRVIKGYVYDISQNYIKVMYTEPSGLSSESVISAADYEIYDFSGFTSFVVETSAATRGNTVVDYGSLSDIDSYTNSWNSSEIIVCTDNGNGRLLIIRR